MHADPNHNPVNSDDPEVRPHSYDGIQEFDNKLPNWWLWTFYLAVIATFLYWFYFYNSSLLVPDHVRVETRLQAMEALKLAAMGDLSDETLWQMSRNPAFVEAGKSVYLGEGGCVACHGPDLKGGIGLSLIDDEWRWGNKPMSVYAMIANGSPDKASGMQAWEALLGPEKIKQVAAFILSHHTEDSMASATSLNPPISLNQ